MKIATTTGDFDWYAQKGDVCAALTMLADSGFQHIDLNLSGMLYPDSPVCGDGWEAWTDEVGSTAARLGLDFVQAHSSDTVYEEGETKEYRSAIIERELKICQKLGIPGMVVHGVAKPNGQRDDFMETNVALYRRLLRTAEETGVQVYTENTCHQNAPTYYLFDADDMNEICAKVDHPLFGVCWDIGHAHEQKVDQYHAILAMGDSLKAVHIHDNHGIMDTHSAPYSGNVCYDAIVKGLLDVGYKGYFTLEAFSVPVASSFCFCNRQPLKLDGEVYDKLLMPPLSLKIRAERLMLDTARFMLEAYGCYEA